MPDTVALVPAVLEIVNIMRNSRFTPDDKLPDTLTEQDVRDVLQAVEDLNFKLIHVTVIADDYRMQEASEAISAWSPEGVEPSDINAAQIFQDLSHKGWLIVPPQ